MPFLEDPKPQNVMRLAAACLVVLSAPVAVAQEANESPEDSIEEITVVGEKTLLSLKFAAQQAEEDFFKLFNELNENDEFDVFCDKESDTYSRIKRRRCWSPFERGIDEEQLRYRWETGGGLPIQNEGLLRAKRRQQAEMLQQMVLENPELQKLYLRYGQANVRFVTERQRRCGDSILCRNPDEKTREEPEE